MKIIFTNDVQNMFISAERVDIDYNKMSDEESKSIVEFLTKFTPHFNARVLSVLIRDIETEREHKENMQKTDPDFVTKYKNNFWKTINNWDKYEKLAVETLKRKGWESNLKGLYTNFEESYSIKTKEAYSIEEKEVEISTDELNKLMYYGAMYAIGRMTYVVGETVDFIIANKEYISENTKEAIIKEIELRKQKTAEEAGKPNAINYLGWDCDVNDWEKLLKILKA